MYRWASSAQILGPVINFTNRFPSQANEKVSTTQGTSGQNSDGSSRSDSLQSSLESNLRRQLVSSPSCEVIWKPWVTPWGQSRWKPRARVQNISGTAIGLWPTTTTPSGGQTIPKGTSLSGMTPDGKKRQVTLQNVVLCLWSMLRVSDGVTGGPDMSSVAKGSPHLSHVFVVDSMLNVPMENGGHSLHPEFAGWEMEYPPEWLSCAGSETQSTRARRPRS